MTVLNFMTRFREYIQEAPMSELENMYFDLHVALHERGLTDKKLEPSLDHGTGNILDDESDDCC